MEHNWWERLWQAMQRVQKRKSCSTARAVERSVKRKCKKDEHQTEVLLAKASDWSTHVFEPKSVESVTRETTLVKECLKEAHTLAKRKGETLPWLECMPSRIFARAMPGAVPQAVGAARNAQGGGIHWWIARMITTS